MVSRSPVVSFSEGIDTLTQRILYYSGSAPYITTIRGMPGIGKSYFCREAMGKLYFLKSGTSTKPHNLEREKQQKGDLDYVLLEIDQFDNPYDKIIEQKTKELYGKVPDYRIVIIHDLGRILSEKLTLANILEFFDLVVENKDIPLISDS